MIKLNYIKNYKETKNTVRINNFYCCKEIFLLKIKKDDFYVEGEFGFLKNKVKYWIPITPMSEGQNTSIVKECEYLKNKITKKHGKEIYRRLVNSNIALKDIKYYRDRYRNNLKIIKMFENV